MKSQMILKMKKANLFVIKRIEDYQQNRNRGYKKCRFLPTCSEYSKECFKRFGFFKASYLTLKRLAKCNPFHKMEYDPVPDEKYPTLEDNINNLNDEIMGLKP